jgi:glycosyltransferase involved in cell wall biosynthesis
MKFNKNKKICILSSAHSVFDDRIFHKEAKTLASAGYDVTLIAHHDKEEIIDGIKIIPLPKPKNRWERFLKLDYLTYKKALQQKADVYHFHDPELLPWILKLKKKTEAKIIYDVHEHYPNAILDKHWIPKLLRKLMSKLFAIIEQILVPVLDFVIYTTPIVGERYKKMKVPTESIENYPLLNTPHLFKKNPQKKIIIYFGGMTKIRGICELLRAFSVVNKKRVNLGLYLIGDIKPKDFEKEIRDLIIQLNTKDNIKIIPEISYEEKEKYLSRASIGIVTYLPFANNMSCLPNKLFEYMLTGLPVITSDFLLYKKIVEKNNCGICVNPQSPEEIAITIEFLIKNPKKAKKMGENGKKAVLEKYNWEKESKKLLEVYEKLLKE